MTFKLRIPNDGRHPAYKLWVNCVDYYDSWDSTMQGLNNDWRARVVFENLALDRIEFEQEQDMTRFVLKFS